MKPYGYKKMRKPPGDGCHLCMKGLSCSSKRSKTANRHRAKKEVNDEIRESNKRAKEDL